MFAAHGLKFRSLQTLNCFLAFCLLGSFAVHAADPVKERVLLAGAAKSNITPPLGEKIVGGFAPFPAENIHDELHARCLVLDDGQTKIALVICDNLGIRREVFDRARAFIDAETDLPAENVLMAATHTHSATRSEDGWYDGFLARRIADGVRRAINNLEPAKIGWGSVDEPSEVHNRRWFVKDEELRRNPFGGVDKVRMNPPAGSDLLIKPAGPVDPEISFLSVQSTSGRPIALVANYSLHYVGGVRRGDVSADYFGIFSEAIGPAIGAKPGDHPPFVGMLTNGTSGDINNINFHQRGQRREPYEKMKQVAGVVVERVQAAHASIEFQSWVPLGSASRELTLKVRKPDEAMKAYFAKLKEQPEDTPAYHRYEKNYADRVQKLAEGPDEVTIMLQALKIGELGITALPFETFVEIGLELKEKSPFKDEFTIELANGYNGYLPTPAQHELGGYETWLGTNKVQLDASDRITETLMDLMQELQAKP